MNLPSCLNLCAHSAATPATCGVAMLVPSILKRHLTFAEIISTPGPETFAPVLENPATVNPCVRPCNAATEIKPFDHGRRARRDLEWWHLFSTSTLVSGGGDEKTGLAKPLETRDQLQTLSNTSRFCR